MRELDAFGVYNVPAAGSVANGARRDDFLLMRQRAHRLPTRKHELHPQVRSRCIFRFRAADGTLASTARSHCRIPPRSPQTPAACTSQHLEEGTLAARRPAPPAARSPGRRAAGPSGCRRSCGWPRPGGPSISWRLDGVPELHGRNARGSTTGTLLTRNGLQVASVQLRARGETLFSYL